MFPSFTGNSRRPRNVNLSGQRNTNPWAASARPGAPSGASQTVAQAQADREKRQRERDELNAAKKLQKVWRGHRSREQNKRDHRHDFDQLYQSTTTQSSSGRILLACPLLLALFDPKRPDDQKRLDYFVQDWECYNGPGTTALECISPVLLGKLACLIVAGLERRPDGPVVPLLTVLVDLVRRQSSAVAPVYDRYYRLLASYLGENMDQSIVTGCEVLISSAVSIPLLSMGGEPNLEGYRAFAYSFLTHPNRMFLQRNEKELVLSLDLHALSQSIVEMSSKPSSPSLFSKDGLLWLLAHFIALNRATPTSQGSTFLEALYLQLSILAPYIRARGQSYDSDEDDDSEVHTHDGDLEESISPPAYVVHQLDFLVNEDGIQELLSRFTSTASSSARLSEDASLLAGYTLILLRCFPDHSDDIKMRLFQGDITTAGSSMSSTLSSVKYLWRAASTTEVFRKVAQIQTQLPVSVVAPLFHSDPLRDREWRTILLFLELYNFLLRVTDDEDFLRTGGQLDSHPSPATLRIRASGLNIDEIKQLVSFLKNLCYTLYHDLPIIRPASAQNVRLDRLISVSSATLKSRTPIKNVSPSFAGIIGLDVLTLRSTATITMHALYERDSRRFFLPGHFWLMTSKFDMNSFTSAVVLEKQQQEDAAEEDIEDDADEPDLVRSGAFSSAATSRLSRAAQIEKHRQLRRIQRENMLAQAAPKLELLRNMPFIIPFDVRVQIFRQFVYMDKMRRRGGSVDPEQWRLSLIQAGGGFSPGTLGREVLGRHTAHVKRGSVFHDAYEQFYSLGEGLKEPIQITFVDQFDQPEAGIDGGGVMKEFLITVTNEAFKTGDGGPSFFVTNEQNVLYPNPTAFDEWGEILRDRGIKEGSLEWLNDMQDLSKRYEFLGRIVGKCLYEGILIDISFAGFFLLRWSSSGQSGPSDFRANLNELRDLDPELYQGLIKLKNYPGDVADLSLDFSVTDQIRTPSGKIRTITRPLRKDGENIPVTNKDRPLYISYVTNHRLVAQPYRQTKAFLRGLGSIINPYWLSMFNQSELQRLVGGDSSEIDIEDLRSNTIYSGVYSIGDDGQEHPTIKMFWQVMRSLKDAERRDVLKYVTSTPRAPLLGFMQLSPRFSIRDNGRDQDKLPTASTCVNLLKLPIYSSAETLRTKLLYAVQSGAGFDLS